MAEAIEGEVCDEIFNSGSVQSLLEELIESIYENQEPKQTDQEMYEQNLIESTSNVQALNSDYQYKNQLHSFGSEVSFNLNSFDRKVADISSKNLNITSLPTSILNRIFYYISCKDLVLNVALVCKKFLALIEDPIVWRCRLAEEYNRPYPLLPLDSETFSDVHYWQKASVSQESNAQIWKKGKYTTKTFKDVHFSEIDSVWLSTESRFAFSGGRDRQIVQWDLYNEANSRKFLGHAGWVWNLKGLNDRDEMLVSASWDNTVKFWNIETTHCFLTHKLGNAVLSLAQFDKGERRDVVYYSLFNRIIGSFDSRSPETGTTISKTDHRKAVLCLQTYGHNYLFSGSEDSTIKCFDVRTNSLVNQIKLRNIVLSMSCKDEILLASSKNGTVFCIDPKTCTVSYKWENMHDHNVTCIQYDSGAIITGSGDKKVKISEPCVGGEVVRTLSDHNMSVTDLNYRNGVLVTASSDQTVVAYIPEKLAELE
ncbi:F-box/WD repeat-containing protein 9-like [Symsagittifera roscoffensis]|uniref:F-box/WD repeat-containing protein 9-like n=1 Tax=Symsagittifera roscoffensis TaxID=84072 RepID=UPI00307B8953